MNQHIHFIGIGGTGMGPLAKIFLEMGWQVSGSDLQASETTCYLEKLGANIALGHKARNIDGADSVVYSSAILQDNPEYQAAVDNQVKIFHRSELLAQLLNTRRGIAVGGAHGKTTVTSMIAWILEQTGLDPVVLIGARFAPFGPGSKFGHSNIAVAEADESDRSFLRYNPEVAVVTSIEADHLENYNDNFSELVHTYKQFLANVKNNGVAVLGIDDPEVKKIAVNYPQALTYGFSEGAVYRAKIAELKQVKTRFSLYVNEKMYGNFTLKVPGRHNVNNACAAIVVCDILGLSTKNIGQHLATFSGAQRRFQMVCEKQGITVVDDYAHHPTEICATLKSIREGWDRRIISIFQPHRYSRTKFLLDEFSQAFTDADVTIITDIYAPPPEKPIAGISSELIVEKMKAKGKEVYYVKSRRDVAEFVMKMAKKNDLIITMGAGTIWKTANEICRLLS